MEHVAGVRLHKRWSTMNSHQHMLCVKALSMMIKEMAAIAFPSYGSIYCSAAPIDSRLKLEFVDVFCIGPHCGSMYWNCNIDTGRFNSNENLNQGPY